MKRYFRVLILAALLVSLLLAGCSSGPKGTQLDGDALDEALKYLDPAADNMLAGLKANDYAMFSRDFDDVMKTAIDETKFGALYRQLNDQIGEYQSRTLTRVTDFGDYVTAEYAGVFAKSDKVNIVVTASKTEPHKLSGLYFR